MQTGPEIRDPIAYLRVLLILGRSSNLPTVWSNCLAGWLLGGAGTWGHLGFLFVGASLLYTGGMFLNDAFDTSFDRAHRRERPIPSGRIAEREVWIWGFVLLGSGLTGLAFCGPSTAALASFLEFCILLYNAIHKWTPASPVIMGACRGLLLLTAASTGESGVTGLAVWSALVLTAYTIGLSFIARRESTGGVRLQAVPCVLLLLPAFLALMVNTGPFITQTMVAITLLLGWIAWAIRPLLGPEPQGSAGRCVALLIAGMPLVDLLALAGDLAPAFLLFVLLALLAQRFIPAT